MDGNPATRQNDALWTRVLLAMVDLLVGRTQWVVLSAPDVHPWCGASHAGPGRGVDGADGAIQPLVTVLCEPLTQRAYSDQCSIASGCSPLSAVDISTTTLRTVVVVSL